MRSIAFAHLILVPGHAIWKMCGDPLADASWFLRDYQRGEPPYYIEHIRRGVEMAAVDAAALLVFSGGQTFAEAGPRSEALGYWALAEHYGWWSAAEVRERSILEDFSADSLENVLFSICRFHEFASRWPERITVAGWGFKTARFTGLHRAALRFPAERFAYVAVNNPAGIEAAAQGEAANRAAFAADPYGSRGPLVGKRRLRNPFRRRHGFTTSCPELAALLHHRGPDIFAGPLPWADAILAAERKRVGPACDAIE